MKRRDRETECERGKQEMIREIDKREGEEGKWKRWEAAERKSRATRNETADEVRERR